MSAVFWLSLLGCPSSQPAELGLDGPAEVRVAELGPVDGPSAVLSGGEQPEGVVWTASPPSVAKVEADGHIVAVGPGTATVTGAWKGQEVAWTLLVEPPMTLVFLDAPARLRVGEMAALRLEGRLGESKVAPGAVQWASSDASIADVSATGELTGVAPGIVYVTASSGGSEAMLEVEIGP